MRERETNKTNKQTDLTAAKSREWERMGKNGKEWKEANTNIKYQMENGKSCFAAEINFFALSSREGKK